MTRFLNEVIILVTLSSGLFPALRTLSMSLLFPRIGEQDPLLYRSVSLLPSLPILLNGRIIRWVESRDNTNNSSYILNVTW